MKCALLVISSLALLTACGNEGGTKTTATATASATATAKPKPEPVVEEKGLEVLEAGKDPEKRAFAPRSGEEQIVTVATAKGQAMVGEKIKPTPASNLTFAITCGDADDGVFTCGYEVKEAQFDDPKMPAGIKKQLEKEMQKMVGMKGEVKVTDHGIVRNIEPEVPDDETLKLAAQGLSETMNNLFVPLPNAPIGVGAKWKRTQELVVQQLAVKQEVTYTLAEVAKGGLKIEAKMKQVATKEKQPLELVKGLKLDVSKYDAEGESVYELPEGRIVPAGGNIELTASMSVERNGTNKKDMTILTTSRFKTNE